MFLTPLSIAKDAAPHGLKTCRLPESQLCRLCADQSLYLCLYLLQLLPGRNILDADLVHADVKAAFNQLFLNLSDTLSSPSIGAEGKGLAVFRGKSLEVAEEGCHVRHHIVVKSRRADSDVFAVQHKRDDIGNVLCLQINQLNRNALA